LLECGEKQWISDPVLVRSPTQKANASRAAGPRWAEFGSAAEAQVWCVRTAWDFTVV